MSTNARFYALIAVVLVVVGGLFFLIRGKDDEKTAKTAAPSVKKVADDTRENIEPGEVTSTRRESRLTATASRPSAPRETSASTKVGVYAISGQVTLESDESPVEGADVNIYWMDKDAAVPTYDEENVWKARTNVKGFFRVDKLPASRYTVIATKGDLSGISGAAINARETEDNVVSLALKHMGAISGQVLNDEREPVAGALIALGHGKRGTRDIYGGSTQAKSASDGSFTLNYVQEGTWTVQAKAEGYAVGQVTDLAQDAQGVEIVLKQGGSVSGTVVSVDSTKPVPNVALSLSAGDRFSLIKNQKGATDAEGKFEFHDLADGAYDLALDKQPYVISGQAPPVTISNANKVEDIKLAVLMGGSITGRATDAVTGAPIVNMQFRTEGGPSSYQTAETDEDGVYRLEGLQPGQYTVRRMWMAGYRHGEERENKQASVRLGEETSGIDFAVPPGISLRGRVVDKDGEPLPLVDVTSADAKNSEGESMVTDEKGKFVHRGFSAGTVVTISAQKAGYSAPPMLNVEIPDHDLDGIEIVMDTGGSIAGTVVDKSGKPLDDVYISAVLATAVPGQAQQQGFSRDGGAFKVQGLDEGKYKLLARPPQSWNQPEPTGNEVQVGKGENVTGVKIVLDFDSGSKIAGRVVDSSGKPIKDVNVQAYMPMGGGGGGNTQTDDDGKYELVGLKTGSYMVSAYHQNYTNFQQQAVDAPNPNFNITMRGKATIEGRVIEARSGNPVRTFTVMAMSGQIDRIDPGTFWGNNGQTFVNDEGKFEIKADDGGATLYVRSQGYAPATLKISDAKEGQTKSGVEIRLDAGGVVEGTVTAKSGEVVAGARIFTGRPPMGDWELQQRPAAATTDANGAFRLESLPAQDVRMYAVHESYAMGSATAKPSAGGAPTTVQIVMGSGATIKGTILVNGEPAPGYGVSVFAPDGGYQNNVQAGSNGEYTVEGIPEGTVMLSVYGTQPGVTRRNVSKQASVVADQVTTIDFNLTDGNAIVEGTVTRGGQPVAGAYVNIALKSEEGIQEGSNAQSDAKGAFRMENLSPGPAVIMIHVPDPSASNQQMRTYRVELVDGETTRVDANLDAGIRVGGKVTGTPQGWMTQVLLMAGSIEIPADTNLMEFYQGAMDRIAGAAQAAADGTFQIEGAEPGEYTVFAITIDPQSAGQTYKHTTAPLTVTENGEANVEITIP